MIRRKTLATTFALALVGLLSLAPVGASAAPAPAWKITVSSQATNFPPDTSPTFPGTPQYKIIATNVGAAPTSGPITVTDTLSAGLTVSSVGGRDGEFNNTVSCSSVDQTASCEDIGIVYPGELVEVEIRVDVGAVTEGTVLVNQATVSGGGAPSATAKTLTTISTDPAPFGLLPGANGLGASLTRDDGSPASQAGSHPFQLDIDLGFSSLPVPFGLIGTDGGVRTIDTILPPGIVVDPSATPVRCTEAELETSTCPQESAAGVVSIVTSASGVTSTASPLYNMVPPPGSAAALGFDALGSGIYVHILGGLREGDYAISATSSDVLARGLNPLIAIKAQLWGDPSSPSFNEVRGICINSISATCPVEPQDDPLLTMPTACSDSLAIGTRADSWRDMGNFRERDAKFTDANGDPMAVSGCNALDFSPTLSARPTTNVADAPSGLDVDLHIPQSSELDTLAEAHLRKAVVTLPEGLVVNPSGANGLAGCSSKQIGLASAIGATPVRFDGKPVDCPNASKIGSVEVASPLLAQYDAENKVQRDPETGDAIPDPLPGAVYVATPHDNPFDSLLAVYVVVDDPQSGILVKLAGHVEADPITGRLTTTFDENPQLPFEDFKLKFFGGANAALRTPAICGTYSTTSAMTPWSAPDSGPPATPKDTYPISASPAGGSCPTTQESQPHSPALNAGTIAPEAGSYSPFVLNVKRNDGSQELSTLSVKTPPGLLGKLAGIPYCPEGALAAAAAKSGQAEKADASCPAASRVGSVDVAAGAGPVPYNTSGTAYLAGPYKGAPLSLAIVTPATAGPYDLGTVVVRSALRVDPVTAQITADSDPIPHILQGIPLDVRSIAVKLDRPNFTLNPTSCDPMQLIGSSLSVGGGSAALLNPFQVGGCRQLPFKPRLSLQLKGGTRRAAHPKLIANLKAKPGEANIAAAEVRLPRSAFLDQAHIKTVCTRVQFAADACPPGSIYGKASATTPLLDYPVSGNVYLRSSNHKLPDLVVDLRGPERQPIRIELAGKTDSVKGALRNTFEAVPDAPVSSFHLELFGGKRGLVINSRNLCAQRYRAVVNLDGQNGKVYDTTPVVGSNCRGTHGK